MRQFIVALFIALTTPSSSVASTLVGNPSVGIVLEAGSAVYVHSVVLYPCSADPTTYPVDETVTTTAGTEVELDEGSYCDLVVRVRWAPNEGITPVAVSGFSELVLDELGDGLVVSLDAAERTAHIE